MKLNQIGATGFEESDQQLSTIAPTAIERRAVDKCA